MKKLAILLTLAYGLCLIVVWFARMALGAVTLLAAFGTLFLISAIASRLTIKDYHPLTLPILAAMFLIPAVGIQVIVSRPGVLAAIEANSVSITGDRVYVSLDQPIQTVVVALLIYCAIHWRVLPRKPRAKADLGASARQHSFQDHDQRVLLSSKSDLATQEMEGHHATVNQ